MPRGKQKSVTSIGVDRRHWRPHDFNRMQSIIDGVDHLVVEMEKHWGVGRLRLLVDDDLRMKFDRQREKYSDAIWNAANVAEVQYHADAMRRGWQALHDVATAAGAQSIDVNVWEVLKPDGTVAAIVRSQAEAHLVARDGRRLEVYTTEEIGRLLGHYRDLAKVKLTFPGAEVVDVRDKAPPISDDDLNDPLPPTMSG